MTTIVYRDGVLAGDGRATRGETIVAENAQKIFGLPDGGAVGFSGRPDVCTNLYEWLVGFVSGQQVGDMPELEDESTVIRILPDGQVLTLSDKHWWPLNEPFTVAGSGSEAALGALHGGATAVEAVKAACRVDPWSGGHIRSITLQAVVDAIAAKKAPKSKKAPAPRKRPSKAIPS